MALVNIFERFKIRGGLLAAIKSLNEVPLDRELVVATDSGTLKVGNGTDTYNARPALNPGFPAFKYVSDTGSTADSDPGAGLFKWNNATQSSATFLYFDDTTSDSGIDLSAYFTSLGESSGIIHLVSEEDRNKWQAWKWTAITDAAGYWKFAVALQASSSSIADNVPVRVTFVPLSYTDDQVRQVMEDTLEAGTDIAISVNSSGNIVIDATGGGGGGGSYLDPRTNILDPISDFLGKPPAAVSPAAANSQEWILAALGSGGSVTSINGGNSRPGVWRIGCGGTSTARTCISMGAVANVALGGGQTSIFFGFRVPTLSDGTQRYEINIGLRDTWTAAVSDRVELFYRDNINSGRFTIARQSGGGAVTVVNGSTTIAANTFYACELRINSGGTVVDLYVNGSSDVTTNTGIPTNPMVIGANIEKSVGATSRDLDLDYLVIQKTFSSSR